jgi:hypothetical protein
MKDQHRLKKFGRKIKINRQATRTRFSRLTGKSEIVIRGAK